MSWHYYAACIGKDPELFFPVGTTAPALDQTQQATQVCAGCPVKCLCLEWAVLAGIDHGIWVNERRALKLRTRRHPTPMAVTAR